MGNALVYSNKNSKKTLYGSGGRMTDTGVDVWVYRCYYCRGEVNSRQSVTVETSYYAHPRCKKRNKNKEG